MVFVAVQDWMCKIFSVLDWYTIMAIIAWMFVEGLFLHGRVTIAVFNVNPPFKAYYFTGWGELTAPAVWFSCVFSHDFLLT